MWVLALFEQSYAEATNEADPKKSDIFGNESLANLSQLVVRLTKLGAFEAATLATQLDAPKLGPVKSCITFFDHDSAAATHPMLKVAGGKLAWWRQDAAHLDGITELTLLRKPGGGLFMTATNKETTLTCYRCNTAKLTKGTNEGNPAYGGSGTASCDDCQRSMPTRDAFSCRPCTADLCDECYAKRLALVTTATPPRTAASGRPGRRLDGERLRVGDKVQLTPAGRSTGGCLRLGDIGTIVSVDNDSQPYNVQKIPAASHSDTHWYREHEIVHVEESVAEGLAAEEPAAEAPQAQELDAMISHPGCPPPEDKLLALLTDMARMAASVGVVLTGDDWPELSPEDRAPGGGGESAMKKCPNGHPLLAYATPGGSCDGCRKSCSSGTTVMDCRECNWWLCTDCAPLVNAGPRCPSCSTTMIFTEPSVTSYNGYNCDGCNTGGHSGARFWCANCRADMCEACHPRSAGGSAAYEGLDMHRHPLRPGPERSFNCSVCTQSKNERCRHCLECDIFVCAACWKTGKEQFEEGIVLSQQCSLTLVMPR